MQRLIPTGLTVGLAALVVGTLMAASERASLDQKLPSSVGNFEPLHEGAPLDTSAEETSRSGAPNLHRAAPDLPIVPVLLGVTPDDVRKLMASWAPGKVLPPAFDFVGMNLRAWSGRARSPSSAP